MPWSRRRSEPESWERVENPPGVCDNRLMATLTPSQVLTKEYQRYFLPEEMIYKRELPSIIPPSKPVIAEIGVGSGRLLCELAQSYPECEFIGVDLFHKPLTRTAKKFTRHRVSNARLLRFNAVQPALIFPNHSLDGLIINFPDPWPKDRHARHRFFYGPVCEHLRLILKPGGWVFLQTDQEPYFNNALTLLKAARFEIHIGAYPDVWVHDVKSGFQMLFENKQEAIFRVLAHCQA